MNVGDTINPEMVGTEKQVFARIYTHSHDRETVLKLAKQIYDLVEVYDESKTNLKLPFPQNVS